MPDINTLLLREAAERVAAFDAACDRVKAAALNAIIACRAAAAACERVVAEAEGRAHDAARCQAMLSGGADHPCGAHCSCF